VAASSLLVVAGDVVQAPNDKQQLEPILEQLDALPKELGDVDTLLADNGYFSDANVNACAHAGIDPLINPWPNASPPRRRSRSTRRPSRRWPTS
jgi:IS5 family transposase